MKRKWNAAIYIGFIFAIAAFATFPFFIRFPATRDVPWANLLLFALSLAFLVIGWKRAYGQSAEYRGKVSGAVLGFLSVALLAFFLFINFSFTRLKPAQAGVPRVGQKAPDFTLPDMHGNAVTLSQLWGTAASGASGTAKDQWVLLIFYRGYW